MKRIVLILLAAARAVAADPYQLLESESDVLTRRGWIEIKTDIAHEAREIPVWLSFFQVRYGIFGWLEAAASLTYARFTERETERLSEFEFKLKSRFEYLDFAGFRTVLLLKYREAPGEPIIAQYNGGLDNVILVVSPHADGGRDATFGVLAGNSFVLFGRRYVYSLGLEYTRAAGRDYGDYTDGQKDIVALSFSPRTFFLDRSLMLTVESRYVLWINRGDFVEMTPQVRWEFEPWWVLEFGVTVLVHGGASYRITLGLVYGFEP